VVAVIRWGLKGTVTVGVVESSAGTLSLSEVDRAVFLVGGCWEASTEVARLLVPGRGRSQPSSAVVGGRRVL
jgi:hypothetical protein